MTNQTETQRVAQALRDRISSGELPIDAWIPSTQKLEAEYEVSKTVVRDAVSDLKSAGLLRGQPGKGVYVIATPAMVASESTDINDLASEVRELRSSLDELVAEAQSDQDSDVRSEIAQLRRLVAVLQTHLIDLYNRVGQPYPYNSLPNENTSTRRTA